MNNSVRLVNDALMLFREATGKLNNFKVSGDMNEKKFKNCRKVKDMIVKELDKGEEESRKKEDAYSICRGI